MKKGAILFVFMLFSIFHFGQTHSLLKDIGAGEEHGLPSRNQATDWNGKSYFISYDNESFNNQIWSTDGTSANTVRVLTANYPDIEFITSVDNYLIFNGWSENGRGIFRSNGTQGGTEVIMEFPSQEIVLMQKLNGSKVVFVTENFVTESTHLWVTDGTTNGTINLGQFELKADFTTFSYFNSSIIFTEKSTNSNIFPPVITDGTIEGTMLVTDFINASITDDIDNVNSAVGTTDVLFVNTETGGKVFNGTSVENFNVTGDYIHGFKLDHLHILFTSLDIAVYNSLTGFGTELALEPYYFSEPISDAGNVYFHGDDGYVYRTNGTQSGTKKISSTTIGATNYDPYLFASEDIVLYSTDQGNDTELWIVHLESELDSVFNTIKPSWGFIIEPYAFLAGGNIVYGRYTQTDGREYWVYNQLPTGVKDLPESHSITLSPNPVEDEVIITFGEELPANTSLSIYNAAGQILWHSPVSKDKQVVDITGFSSGQYFIHIRTDEGNQYGGSFVKR